MQKVFATVGIQHRPCGITHGCITMLILLGLLLSSMSAFGQITPSPASDRAIEKGLAFLASHQLADGAFTGFDESASRAFPAARSLIAFMSAGHSPMSGKYSLTVRNGLEFLLRQLPEDGDFGHADGSGAAGHAAITIALAQCYGMHNDPAQRKQIREALGKSLNYILASQDITAAMQKDAAPIDASHGGWKIDGRNESDLTTTFWMMLSLFAIHDAGLNIPEQKIILATNYTAANFKSDKKVFVEVGNANAPALQSAAMGILMLGKKMSKTPIDKTPQNGAANNPPVSMITPEGKKMLVDRRVADDTTDYHAAISVVLFAGLHLDEPTLKNIWQPTRDSLLKKQLEDGSWTPPKSPPIGTGSILATASAVLTLSMPQRVLPIFQLSRRDSRE